MTFVHVAAWLHYGPVFSQAQNNGLDGMQAHMSGSEEKTQSGFLCGAYWDCVAQGVVLIIPTSSVQALLCARLAPLL